MTTEASGTPAVAAPATTATPSGGDSSSGLGGDSSSVVDTALTAPAADADSTVDAGYSVEDIIAEDAAHNDSPVDSGTGATIPVAPVAPVAAAPTPPVAPAVPPVAPVAAPAAAPVPPTEQATGQPPAPAPASASAPAAQPIDFAKHRDEYLPKLTELYKIPDEEVEGLRTSPETYLPKLAARLHYEATTSIYQSIRAELPHLMQEMQAALSARETTNKAFFDAWPTLKAAVDTDGTKLDLVKGYIKTFRSANPNADLQAVIKGAGMLAAISMGIPLEAAPPVAAPAAAPVVPRPARPAGVGISAANVTPPAAPGAPTGNVFEEMASEFLNGS